MTALTPGQTKGLPPGPPGPRPGPPGQRPGRTGPRPVQTGPKPGQTGPRPGQTGPRPGRENTKGCQDPEQTMVHDHCINNHHDKCQIITFLKYKVWILRLSESLNNQMVKLSTKGENLSLQLHHSAYFDHILGSDSPLTLCKTIGKTDQT